MTADPSTALIERVQTLTAQLEEIPDFQARAVADELVSSVIQLYGAGLERIVEALALPGASAADVREPAGDETADGLRITPRPLHSGTVHTYADHRMVMAAAVLGLAVPGIVVEDVATVAKTMPEFTHLWAHMLDDRVPAGA